MSYAYYRLKEYELALDRSKQALQIHQQIGNQLALGITLHNLGTIHVGLEDFQKAISFLQDAIEIKENIRSNLKIDDLKTFFAGASNQVDTYEVLINLLWDQGKHEAAFEYSERAKARAFLDQMGGGQVDFRTGVNSELLTQEQQIKVEITSLRNQLITLQNGPKDKWNTDLIRDIQKQLFNKEQDYEFLLTRLKNQSPETAALISVDIISLAEVQAQIEPDTTLLEFFVTDSRTLVFLITRSGFKTATLDMGRERAC